MNEIIVNWLKDWGVNPDSIYWLYWIVMVLLLAVIIYALHLSFTKGLVPLIRKVTKGTASKWDDILLNDTFLSDVSYLIPSIVIACVLPLVIPSSDMILEFLLKVNYIYMVVAIAKMLCTFLNSLYAISNQTDKLKNHPLKGIYQMLKIVVVCVALIIILSILINKNRGYILTALGASAAVLMLVFKDMIMGLVAGVQLSANDMLRPGDWISMPKHGADGSVVEVTLTTVKVQNCDKTITTSPPYCLISDSFQNWRGMTDSGGRRIKRSVYIDMRSITFCTKEQLKEFAKKGWLEGIEREDQFVVNLHVFRNYLDQFLRHHPRVNQNLMIMVRQLQPTAQGLPLELYFFYNGTNWVPYEHLQSEIFEHVFAMLPTFGLQVFQAPMGIDFLKSYND